MPDWLERFFSASAASGRLVERLCEKAQAARWRLPREKFVEALERSAKHRFREAAPRDEEIVAYFESLHVEDLALACACAEGNEAAWEHFVARHRQDLYAAARAIAAQNARDLADSLYAELYGLEERAGKRRSLFRYFHGRSKLSTWLRAVLAQRQVDALRAARGTESLEDVHESGACVESRSAGPPDPDRASYLALLQAALDEAISALDSRDRLRLALYYVQGLKLAEIGRVLGEHEATASRKLDRTRQELRKRIERALRDPARAGLGDAQIRLCFEYAVQEWPFDLTLQLGSGQARALSFTPRGTEGQRE